MNDLTLAVTNQSTLDYIPAEPQDYMIGQVPTYYPIRNEFTVYDGLLKNHKPLLLKGPKGIGKTLSVAYWVSQRPRMPFIQYDCSEGTKESNLIGRAIIHKDGTTPFKLGVIPTAIEIANKTKMAVLCLEEIGSLPPSMQKLLNPLLDWRSGLYVDSLNKTFSLDSDAKLIVFATSNPSSHGGIYELNHDLRSRFATWLWDYPDTKEEMGMLNSSGIPSDFASQVFRLAIETRALEKKGTLDYALSTRDISHIFDIYRSYDGTNVDPKISSINLKVLGNYDDEDQIATVKSRIESIFGKSVLEKDFSK